MAKQLEFNLGDWKADLRPHKTFRIAVSGDVVLTKLETSVVDTSEFQRLRDLKQLGLCNLVYPSAMHTRFEHTLGAVKKADTILQATRASQPDDTFTQEQLQMARLVALFHDVANVPMGHTLEDETRVLGEHQEDENRFKRVIGPGTKIGSILMDAIGEQGCAALLKILTTKDRDITSLGEDAFICDVVKNTVCADLLDYLERDAYFCNLAISFGDRFLRYVFLARPGDGTRRVAIRLWKEKDDRVRDDLVSELIQLLQTRYYLAERVYFHHTKLVTSAMIGRAVWAALRATKGAKLNESELLGMGDAKLMDRLTDSKDPVAHNIATMLNRRALYKRAYALHRSSAEADKRHGTLERIKQEYHLDAANRFKREDEIADLCGLEPGDVLICCPDPDMNLKAANMLVTWAHGFKKLREVEEPLIRQKIESILLSHRNLWSVTVYVHPEKLTDRVRQRLTDLCDEQFAKGVQYSPEVVERLLFDVAAEGAMTIQPATIRRCATEMMAESKGQPSNLTRKYLREQLEKAGSNTAQQD
jgi:uncharacterized protein